MSPSSLARREACPGSWAAERGLPEEESESAQAGTDGHEALAGDLSAGQPDRGSAGAWVAGVARELAAPWPPDERRVEEPLALAWLHPALDAGTADLVAARPFERGMVADWKFGFRGAPAAAQNIQLAAYALGLARRYDLVAVEVVLVEVPLERVTRATLGPAELAAAAERVRGVVAAARSPLAPRRPSADACRYCRARGSCPALLAVAGQLPAADAVSALPAPELARLLPLAYAAKAAAGALEAEAYRRLAAGERVPGWTLVEGRRTRTWRPGVGVEQLAPLALARGVAVTEVLEPPVVRSPAALEHALGLGRHDLRDLVDWHPGRPKLREEPGRRFHD